MRASMSPNHYRTLIMLKHFGPDNMGSLAKKIAVSKQQMTPIIDRLAKDELIVRMPSEADRRIINIALTGKAKHFSNRTSTNATSLSATSSAQARPKKRCALPPSTSKAVYSSFAAVSTTKKNNIDVRKPPIIGWLSLFG